MLVAAIVLRASPWSFFSHVVVGVVVVYAHVKHIPLNEDMRGFESEAPCCSKENLLGSRVCWRIVMCELHSDGHGREHCAGALDELINLTYFVSIALALAWSMNSSCFLRRLRLRVGVGRSHCSACLSLVPFLTCVV